MPIYQLKNNAAKNNSKPYQTSKIHICCIFRALPDSVLDKIGNNFF